MGQKFKEEQKVRIDQASIQEELCQATHRLYLGIVKLHLDTGKIVVLHSYTEAEIGCEYDWKTYLKAYTEQYILPPDRARVLNNFSTESIRERLTMGRSSFAADFGSYVTETNEDHVTMLAFTPDIQEERDVVYVLVRNADADYLLRSIVQQYVYSTCDYFIFLDAKHNSYNMVSYQKGTPLPQAQCEDYEREMVAYAKAYVAPEDQGMVIREMHLPRVLEQLNQNGIHSFTCGVLEKTRGYTRKRLEYRYQNQEEQMILLARTDITDIYMEGLEKQRQLEAALHRAQTDPLTKLWNRQATMDKIAERLTVPDAHYAALFIDLDNFKKINDTMEHPAGDRVLCQVAEVLSKQADAEDVAGRIGGDEFLFFTELGGYPEEAGETARRIGRALNRILLDEDAGGHVSGSIGVALYPEDGMDYTTLVKAADRRLYQAKARGKNCYCL